MRLTDEEKRIADDVAVRLYFDPMRAGDAWECAVNYIAARRKAFGEAEPPGAATAAGVQPKSRDARLDELAGPPDEEWCGPFCKPTESGPATAAGVAEPPATVPLAQWSSLVEKVEQIADDICGVGTLTSSRPEEWLDAIAREYHRVRVESARQGSPRGVVVTAEQREALVDVRRFFGQRSDFHIDPEERRHAYVISRHVGDLLDASDWPTVMPDGTTVSAAIDAAKGGET